MLFPDRRPNAFQQLGAWLLPGECVLCGANAGPDCLCPSCCQALPGLGDELCPQCAQPTPGNAVCGGCLSHPPAFDATFAACSYAYPADRLVQALKFNGQLGIARFMAAHVANALTEGRSSEKPGPAIDLLLPVPMGAQRLQERGFNQAVEIARPLAKELGLALDIEGLVRCKETAPQADLPWRARARNVRGAFRCQRDYSGKHVALVDDVMTTGATLDAAARIAKAAGAIWVSVLVFARTPPRH